MDSIFEILFPENKLNEAYSNYNDYLNDLCKQVQLMTFYYVYCSMNMEDSFKDFNKDKLLSEIQIIQAFEPNPYVTEFTSMVIEEYNKSKNYIERRLQISGDDEFFAYEYLKTVYKLNDFQSFFLLLNLVPHIDENFKRIFSYLKKDKEDSADINLAMKLYYFVDDIKKIDDFYNIKNSAEQKLNSLCFDEDTNNISSRTLAFIMSNGENTISMNGIWCYIPKANEPLLVKNDIAMKMASIVKKQQEDKALFFYLNGCKSIGKKTQVKRFAQIMDRAVIMVDVSKLDFQAGDKFREILLLAFRERNLTQGDICFYNFDALYPCDEDKENDYYNEKKYIDFILRSAEEFANTIFVLSSKPQKDPDIILDRLWINIPIEYPNKEESIILWEKSLADITVSEDLQAFEMANKFNFTPGQIIGTVKEAYKFLIWNQQDSISRKDLCRCAYTQIEHDLDKQATLIYAKHNFDQLILAEKEKEMLRNACDQIKYKHVVYNNWGFNNRISYGKGISMLFAGPPGTGKTMAAQVVANELDIEIYKVDLSQVVSKYIGETEKNLGKLFEEAKKSNVILFFDETDALLGKRTEVKDSHDKNANLETSYLLQKMEEYDGITVLSTNYLENIDAAFFRRISYVIHFPFPDPKSRKGIWENIFPHETPMDDDVDFDYLANQFEVSGGSIKNIAVTSAFLAAKSDKRVGMKHIIKGIKYELTKQGKVLIKEDFGEYGYLLT